MGRQIALMFLCSKILYGNRLPVTKHNVDVLYGSPLVGSALTLSAVVVLVVGVTAGRKEGRME